MGLPRPDPFSVPDTPEQFLSDWLLHAGIGAGTVIGVYAYTGLYAGPGHAGIIYHAFFSRAVVGSTVGGLEGSVALADTMYAMSVYAQPFVAAARFIGSTALVVGMSTLARGDVATRQSTVHRTEQSGIQLTTLAHRAMGILM